jgi:hypothetical protein
VQQRQALPAGHRGVIIGRNPFHFGPMRGFLVARVAQDHAVLVQGMQIALLSFIPGQHRSFMV